MKRQKKASPVVTPEEVEVLEQRIKLRKEFLGRVVPWLKKLANEMGTKRKSPSEQYRELILLDYKIWVECKEGDPTDYFELRIYRGPSYLLYLDLAGQGGNVDTYSVQLIRPNTGWQKDFAAGDQETGAAFNPKMEAAIDAARIKFNKTDVLIARYEALLIEAKRLGFKK